MKLLLVEDSEIIREGIIEMLNQIGDITICQAENGPKALEAIENDKPDTVVLDLGLPYLSGFEVLRKTKSKHPEVTFIVLTNHSEKYFIDMSKKYGADYFFDKSEQLNEFSETIKILSKNLLTNEL